MQWFRVLSMKNGAERILRRIKNKYIKITPRDESKIQKIG